MTVIRVGIADDEPLARERLASMLEDNPRYAVVANCVNGSEALAAIRGKSLDVLFLDVRMPELDGFQTLESVENSPLPIIVFVTAYDDYALRAFDASAIDYLLKPFDRARFDKTLARVEERLDESNDRRMSGELRELLSRFSSPTPSPPAVRFAVKTPSGIHFVRSEEIDWIDSAGNYVEIHAAGRKHLVRETLKSVESKLDPARFIRVHRSAIINVDRLQKLQPYFHGEYVVTLQDGTKLTSSRGYSDRLRALLD